MSYLTRKERDEFTFKAIVWTALLGAIAIYLLLLVGCGHGMTKMMDIEVSSITWDRSLPKNCGSHQGTFAGCAEWQQNNCKITMPEDSPDWVVAHEFRHCFGYAHGN